MFPSQLLTSLASAARVVVLTGAGISAESGIPTFREAQTGLWEKYDPLDLATPQAFAAHPQRVWRWYAWRRGLVAKAQPNAGHRALVEWEKIWPSVTVITQNVDGLHQAAGSSEVIELHGGLNRIKCSGAGHQIAEWEELPGEPPACPRCGTLLRPDVVWFGEMLPRDALTRAVAASQEADVFFSIGTSALVEPAASLPVEAVDKGALLVEINPQRTPLSSLANFVLEGTAGEIVPALTTAVCG